MYLKKTPGIIFGTAVLICALMANAALAMNPGDQTRDPLAFLKRAISDAGAPSLSADQETQINALITAFKAAQPTGPSQALIDAYTAFDNAILAGDLTTATTQAGIISNAIAAENKTRLVAIATFATSVRTILKNGGQYSYLTTKFSSERVLGLLESLVGQGGLGHGGH